MLAHMLGAIGGEYQQFSEGIDLLLNIQQRRAQLLTERSAAGFARSYHVHAAHAQLTRQQTQLSGLSASINSFEGNKSAGHIFR
jgi:hypothetical protein